MPKKIKTLPPIRVSEGLHNAVQAVAVAQDVAIAEVVRLALLDYCMPKVRPVVPIIGELSADMNWENLAMEFKRAKAEFQDQVAALVLAGEGQ